MKKKTLLLMMGLSVTLFAWGCGKKSVADELNAQNDSPTGTPAVTQAAEDTAEDTDQGSAASQAPVREAYEVSDYITLGQYKGVKAVYDKLEVTDADVDKAIEDDLSSNSTEEEVKDRAVQTGDIVNIDYEGLKDGVAFDGGTAQGYDLEIGSGSFIPGFEDGLIGHNTGEKVKLDVTFPEEYPTEELAGKAVVFNVTINSIKAKKLPELNDEYVKDNTDYKTVAEYKEGTRAELAKSNEETMKNAKMGNILQTIISNSEISSYPQTLIDYYGYEMESYYTQYAQMFGMDLAAFIEANGMNQAAYDEQKKSYAENRAAQELVLNSVIKTENMVLTDDEYSKGLADYMEKYDVKTEDEFYQNYGTKEQIKESLLWEKAMNFLVAESVE
jgi:trigger factor